MATSWAQRGNLRGPTGATGSTGPAGADGKTVLNGAGAPAGALGAVGDFYIDTTNSRLYGPKVSASAWPSGYVSLIGPQGPTGQTGSTGPAGADGKTVRSGAGAPASGLGVVGDFYIDTTAEAIYGPKTAGGWGSATSLIGPQGPTGQTGSTGATGPAGADGTDAIRYNLSSNPSVESAITGWTGTSPLASVTRSTSNPGRSAANASATASTSGTGTIRPPQCVGIEAGRAYTFQAMVRCSVARTVTPQIQFQTDAGVSVGSVISGTAVSISTTWTLVSVTAVAPDTATRLQPILSVASLASGNIVQADEVLVEQAPILRPYFDGDDPGGSWSGTAMLSTSELYVPAAQPVASLRQTAAQTLSATSAVPITFNVADVDTHGGWSSASPSRYTCKKAGLYWVSGKCGFLSTANYTAISIKKNGALVPTGTVYYGASSLDASYQGPVILLRLAVGDYVELAAGPGKVADTHTVAPGDAQPSMHLQWIST